MPLQRLCITMICWHMLKQLGNHWKKTTAWKNICIFSSFSTLNIGLQDGKSSSQGRQFPIDTIFVLISSKNTSGSPSVGGNFPEFTDFYDITTWRESSSYINKAQPLRDTFIYLKNGCMRSFGGDIFMCGCNFDSTFKPSVWQFYK